MYELLTITPARIVGIDRQLGSLEKGKIANIVVTDKAIFEKDAKVKRVYIDGRESKLPTEEEKARRASNCRAEASSRRSMSLTGGCSCDLAFFWFSWRALSRRSSSVG